MYDPQVNFLLTRVEKYVNNFLKIAMNEIDQSIFTDE